MQSHDTHFSTAQDPTQQFLTVPQAAQACGIPAYKIRRAVKLGTLPSYGMLDRRRYVLVADIRAAMAVPIAPR
uniref:helix-turn-helix domain-containing protein n=1 Tax=Methylobacterium sp. B34 TaxID=95563 RepID=UPI0035E3E23C